MPCSMTQHGLTRVELELPTSGSGVRGINHQATAHKLAHIRNELSWEFNVGIITPWDLVYQMVVCLKFRFVSCLLNFSHVGTEPWLPGYYQYFFGVNVSCSSTQHGTRSEDRTPTLTLTTKPIRNFGSFINIHDNANEIIFI